MAAQNKWRLYGTGKVYIQISLSPSVRHLRGSIYIFSQVSTITFNVGCVPLAYIYFLTYCLSTPQPTSLAVTFESGVYASLVSKARRIIIWLVSTYVNLRPFSIRESFFDKLKRFLITRVFSNNENYN